MLRLLFLLEAAAPTSSAMERLNAIVARAADPCRAQSRTITVCGRRDGESPYRLPPEARDPGFQVDGPRDSVSRERHRLLDNAGSSMPGSCSAAGAAGATGCMVEQWRRNDQQAGFRSGINLGPVVVAPR